MSAFNLDRFRFDKKVPALNQHKQDGSISPDSEKENLPARVSTASKSVPSRGVVFEDVTVVSDTDEESRPLIRKVKPPEKRKGKEVDERCTKGNDVEEKCTQLMEIFPQRTREELLEVIKDTSTLAGAVAACMIRYDDKEVPDASRKRKQGESSSSQDSDMVVQPSKKRRPSVTQDSEEEGEGDEEGEGPSWEKQESMVRKLQRKFPDQDKEELRDVLRQHEWNVDDALEVLRMFSDPGDDSSFSSPEGKKKKKKKHKDKNGESKHRQRDVRVTRNGRHSRDTRDSESGRSRDSSRDSAHSRDGSRDSEHSRDSSAEFETTKDSMEEYNPKKNKSLHSTWLDRASKKQKPSASSSIAQKLSKFASATSVAKEAAKERKRKARASEQRDSSSGGEGEEEEEEAGSSELEDSEDELGSDTDCRYAGSLKSEILQFFQDASVDELCLISGCSEKKAKKIVELRPFDNWKTLTEEFQNERSLQNVDLLAGCKVVLRQRSVVLGLMSKCEKISKQMMTGVTRALEGAGMKQPSVLNNQLQLKPYQLIGLKWLRLLHEHELSGMLADEMGLGKTIQAIAFLAQLYQEGINGPHLVIVPASTLDNWVREFKLWCPSLKVLVYYGKVEDRRLLRNDILSGSEDFHVIVSTYNLAIGNEYDRSLFRKLPLMYAVFDEGHMLKNMNALRYRHLMAINAEHRILLTGTPLQNNLLELMSLLNFIMPEMFSSSTNQIIKMFSMGSQHEEQSAFERERIAHAKLIMKPFILRRVKSEVLKQLPAKEEKLEFCPMSEKQLQLYQSLVTKLKRSATGEKKVLCNVMMQLRKMANHPLLHRQYYTSDKLKAMSRLMLKEPTHFDAEATLIQEDMEEMTDFELHQLCQRYASLHAHQLDRETILDSGKFHLLTQMLASLKEKGESRVVLFSQFTMILDIVEILLKDQKHRYVRLDGSTPIADRIVLIDEFNMDRDIFVFLLSTRAGGLGINLTSANVVILHDIDYNPYNDKQAEDRCHRVGQTKTVKVIKLISKDTVEDCMLRLGQRKLKLEQDMTAAEEGVEGDIPDDLATLLKASLGL